MRYGYSYIRFEVIIVVSVKVTVFWDVTPCSLLPG
jgi:hypothetical protein